MSTDLKNSILLWVGAIACAGVFWAVSYSDLLRFIPPIPPKLFWSLFAAMLGFQLVRFVWSFWRRRKGESR